MTAARTLRSVTLALLLVSACTRAAYTGRIQNTPLADDDELAVADRAAAQYRVGVRPSADAVVVERVRRVGGKIIDTAKAGPAGERARRLAWEMTVVESPDAHTAAFANGKIFVSTALVRALPNDDELAAALGHAVARVLLRHGGEAIARRKARSAFARLTGVATETSTNPHDERTAEADWVGMALAVDAGYDPEKAVEAFDRLGLKERGAEVRRNLPELRDRRTAGSGA